MPTSYGWEPFPTWKILDSMSSTEYNALTDAKKDYVRIIISAGNINFRENSAVWNALHVIFPDGTETWTALKTASERIYDASPS